MARVSVALPQDPLERCAPYVRLAHDFVTPRGYEQPLRTINDHALLFFRGGGGSFVADDGATPIRAGRLFLIPPGCPHCFAAPAGERYHMLNLHFDPVMRADSRSLYLHFGQSARRARDEGTLAIFPGPRPRRIQAFDLRDPAGYARVFHATLAHFPAQDRTGQLRARAAMLELLAWLHADVAGTDETPPDALARARALIRERYREPLRLGEIAARVGLGRTAFAIAFRRQYGVAPIAYLRRIRIEHAKVLLAAEGLAPKAVAERVGFASVHHFTRAFAHAVGLPPAAYRRGAPRA